MIPRVLGVGALIVAALLPLGCATKGFVREEVQKSETKVTGDVGRVETSAEPGARAPQHASACR